MEDIRLKILETAVRLSAEKGAKELTMEHIATEAGMSKGGVFYHFKNKEVLLEAMMNHIIDQFVANCELLQMQGYDPISATIESAFSDTSDQHNRIMAMIAAVSYDRTLPQRTNCRFEDWITDLMSNGCSRGTALLVTSTIDGYFAARAFGMGNPAGEDRLTLKNRLSEAVLQDSQYWYVQAFRRALVLCKA
jgi:AcrR family transcriptional regulator